MSSLAREILDRLKKSWRERTVALKALSFGLVGVINTIVDATIFFVVYGTVTAAVLPENSALVVANLVAWTAGVTCSFALNSKTTFAAETGGKLRLKNYVAFAVSNLAGLVANTGVLLIAARHFLLPVLVAKGMAIGAGFVVNFSLSHFVVFRARPVTDEKINR